MHNFFTFIKNIFTKNIVIKLSSILLAFVTYHMIQQVISLEVSYDVPLEIQVKPGVAILEKETDIIHVTFKGAPEDLRNLDQKLLKAVVKRKDTSSNGTDIINITSKNIEGARGVTIAKIKPRTVKVTFDHEAQKIVHIEKPTIQGSPLVGHVELEYTQKTATISGSYRRIKEINSVTTEPIDVDGRVESFSKTLRVLVPGNIGVIQVDPQEIQVKVNIITESVSVTLTNIPVLAISEPTTYSGFKFEPPTVNVTITGNSEVVEKLEFGKIRVFANCLDLDKKLTNTIPLSVYLPINKNIETKLEPDTVTIIKPKDDSIL